MIVWKSAIVKHVMMNWLKADETDWHETVIKSEVKNAEISNENEKQTKENWQLISKINFNLSLTGARSGLLVLKRPKWNYSLLIIITFACHQCGLW